MTISRAGLRHPVWRILLLVAIGQLVFPGAAESTETITIAAWNLEYFGLSRTRGFPENTRGGPSYPPRAEEDYRRLAELIQSLSFRVLALSEIEASPVVMDGETHFRSAALDQLVEFLGPAYEYVAGASGGSQHLALLYDTRYVRLNDACECAFEEEEVNGKNLFERQPLLGYFTVLEAGVSRNDFVVVGVHLAAGQGHTKNHDRAMAVLTEELERARGQDRCIPENEFDLVILGDFNASRFDSRKEELWPVLEQGFWDVLADSDTYPATRLTGHPLGLGTSKIDYIVVSKRAGGLAGEEVEAQTAVVHTGLIGEAPEAFRQYASDHLPVSIEIRPVQDDD